MMLQELEHILLNLGEKLEREDVDTLIKECCDAEDDDGFIPYERKSQQKPLGHNQTQPWNQMDGFRLLLAGLIWLSCTDCLKSIPFLARGEHIFSMPKLGQRGP